MELRRFGNNNGNNNDEPFHIARAFMASMVIGVLISWPGFALLIISLIMEADRTFRIISYWMIGIGSIIFIISMLLICISISFGKRKDAENNANTKEKKKNKKNKK